MPQILPTPRAGAWVVGTGMGIPPDTPPRAGAWVQGVGNPPAIRAGSWVVLTHTPPPSERRRPPMGILLTRRSRDL